MRYADDYAALITAAHRRLHAPELNPVESLWPTLKSSLRNRLRSVQYRPGLIPGFLAQTGLGLGPEPP